MATQLKLPQSIARRAAQLALSKKAFDICIVDLRKIKNAFADFFVICSCDSDTQVRAVSSAVQDGLREIGMRALHVEGEQVGQWVLVDFFDVVVHVFHHTARHHYNLERLWGDTKIEYVTSEYDTVPAPNAAPKPRAKPAPKVSAESKAKPKRKPALKPKVTSKAKTKSKPKTAPKKKGISGESL